MEIFPAAVLVVVAIVTIVFIAKEWVHSSQALIECCKQQRIESYDYSSNWRLLNLGVSQKRLFQRWDSLIGLSSCKSRLFYVSTGKTVRIVILDPLLVRDFFSVQECCYCKPSFVRVLRILGNGLFSSSGRAWMSQRSLILPVLLAKEIKRKVQDMEDSTFHAFDELKLAVHASRVVDMHRLFLGLALDILQKTLFGSVLQADKGTLFQTLKRYHHSRRQLVFGLVASLPGYRLLQERIFTQVGKDESWIRRLMKGTIETAQSSERRTLLVDVLLGAFFLAGHETTAALLTWSVYLLAVNPHWQQQAREVVLQIMSSYSSSSIGAWENLSKMKTVGLILMETLRLFPPQPLIGVKENCFGDIRIPPGLEVVVTVAAIHRSEEFWGRADLRTESRQLALLLWLTCRLAWDRELALDRRWRRRKPSWCSRFSCKDLAGSLAMLIGITQTSL